MPGTQPPLGAHGAEHLPAVDVDSYNLEVKDENGFVGDRASKGAFGAILEKWREPLRKLDADPFGDMASEEIGKKTLEAILTKGEPEAAGVVHGAIEDFAQEFAGVVSRFMRLKAWRDTERIAVGGGFRFGRIGELAIGRASVILKGDGIDVDIRPIRNHPDEAGLIGAVHLAPSWIFSGHDSILAVDIGGTNIRAGVVQLNAKKAPDLSRASVWKSDLWRHGDENPKRDEAVERLVEMLKSLVRRAGKEGLELAPFVGIGCPGKIDHSGAIERGAQNLPGNWESSRFNLPHSIREAMPSIGDHPTAVLMHNDAVVQGLSELPFMQDVTRWGVLTIGTGLGNARFSNRGKSAE
ncbi:MAG TPA: ROK family protein [Candidatus Binatia bacterium]|nr:ROK family protein [Candidatus Binatia bacterium]